MSYLAVVPAAVLRCGCGPARNPVPSSTKVVQLFQLDKEDLELRSTGIFYCVLLRLDEERFPLLKFHVVSLTVCQGEYCLRWG